MSSAERAYASAESWRALAEAARDVLGPMNSLMESLRGNSFGDAADAMAESWRAVADPAADGVLPRLVGSCEALAERCERYAEESAHPL